MGTTGGRMLACVFTLLTACTSTPPRDPSSASEARRLEIPTAPAGLIAFSADVDGNWDFYEGNSDIYVTDPDDPDARPVNLTRHPANDYSPEWSPDGRRIAFRTNRDGNHEIYVMDADGSNPVNITANPAEERSAAWSPDGSRIVFASDRDGEFDLYVSDADGSNTQRLRVPGGDEYPTWSPDGEEIAFTNACSTCSGFALYVMSANGAGAHPLGFAAGWPDWSPDGRFLAYDAGAPDQEPSVRILPLKPGAEPRELVKGVQADWSPDSLELVYARPTGFGPPEGTGLDADLYIVGRDGGDSRALTATPGVFEFEPTFQPTGTTPFVSLDPEVMDARYREGLRRVQYDRSAPLRIRTAERAPEDELTRWELSYASPPGGRVPATMVLPNSPGSHPAVILQHGLPGQRNDVLPEARRIAALGAVAMMIDAPWARPGGRFPITFTRRDALDQIQLIVDLRRAVDVLETFPQVDGDRIGYVGVSYGGAMGGLLAGAEPRMKALALVVGDGGLITHATGIDDVAEDFGGEFWGLPERRRARWLRSMQTIEPLYFVRHAAPASLLFQSGTVDEAVPAADAVVYQEAGSEPKEIRWYTSGHLLPVTAECDRLEWLAARLGMAQSRPSGC